MLMRCRALRRLTDCMNFVPFLTHFPYQSSVVLGGRNVKVTAVCVLFHLYFSSGYDLCHLDFSSDYDLIQVHMFSFNWLHLVISVITLEY